MAEAAFQSSEVVGVIGVNEELFVSIRGLVAGRGWFFGRRGRLGRLPTLGLSQHGGRHCQRECANRSENIFASNTGGLAHAACQYFHVTPTCKAREFF